MSNKNPFEIRLEILKMAKDYLEQQYQTNLTFAQSLYQKALESGQVMQDNLQSFIPKSYTVIKSLSTIDEIQNCNSLKATSSEARTII